VSSTLAGAQRTNKTGIFAAHPRSGRCNVKRNARDSLLLVNQFWIKRTGEQRESPFPEAQRPSLRPANEAAHCGGVEAEEADMRHATATPTSGGIMSTVATAQTQTLCRHAHVIAAAAGIDLGPSKVSKLVRRYEHQVADNGWRFWDFIANQLLLTADQRSRVLADPDAYRTISYLDRVGEDAVRNVIRRRGY
jgi:hypothetical protein